LPEPAPPPEAVPAPAVPGTPGVVVRDYRFVGNTVFTARELD
jgi:hypothetical protein